MIRMGGLTGSARVSRLRPRGSADDGTDGTASHQRVAVIRRILVPVADSPAALRGAEFAAELARAIGGEVTLLHVHEGGGVTTLGLEPVSPEEAEEEKLRLAEPVFEKTSVPFRERGLAVEKKVAIGSPAEEIVAVAERGRFDQIVIGSRGMSELRRILTGSVSERVLHRAHCPVTVVP